MINFKKLSSGFTLLRRGLRRVKVFSPAFTIVEIVVVIVVIGILAAVVIVGYGNWQASATATQIKSDLTNAAAAMENTRNFGSGYPVDVPSTFTASSGIPLVGGGSSDGKTFGITATKGNISYRIINNISTPVACAPGFIIVPGSATYGTSDFCVMKYEAKQASSTVPISTVSDLPWVTIHQTTAMTNSPNVAGCTGCHLITEAEYMTIAQNVLIVPGNWSSGVIPRGNSNSSAAMDGTTDLTGINKRTLTLTNGEVIWDLAGNVWEWTTGRATSGQLPGVTGDGYGWYEWTAVTNPGTISPNPSASATGISGAGGWNSGNGIGQISINTNEIYSTREFRRGGTWDGGSIAGVLALDLDYGPGYGYGNVGFRVSR